MSQAQSQPNVKKTVLYQAHKDLSARMAPFGGWDMPIQYSSIQEEHQATRERAGLFDLCHMGRLVISGSDHKNFLHHAITNNVHDLEVGRARYALVLNEQGYALDDILIYAQENQTFVVVNASNREKIISHFDKISKEFDVVISDVSSNKAMIAIQGPQSVAIVNPLCDHDISAIPYYGHSQINLQGVPALIARTGYTGEDGFEIFVASDQANSIWSLLLEHGQPSGLKPVGLAARDTLRLEASMPLYGHELDEDTNPLEAGLRFAVKLKKNPPFVGQEALVKVKENGLTKKLIGLECLDKRVPRQGYPVLNQEGHVIGTVVSGTASPTLKKNIAHAFVPPDYAELGTNLQIQIRNKSADAQVIARPFYKRKS